MPVVYAVQSAVYSLACDLCHCCATSLLAMIPFRPTQTFPSSRTYLTLKLRRFYLDPVLENSLLPCPSDASDFGFIYDGVSSDDVPAQ